MDRVDQRVKKGGHGIPEDVIRKCYVQSMKNFTQIYSRFDNVMVLNNSDLYTLMYRKKDNSVWFDFLLDIK
ncbi:hypothetical protein [Enterococcus sp. AZ103]|uniref:hypothetical protein n=1 Tax=Enterococcus sp. AZ103 TaxID=2774628 RepID=UPI003F25E11B